MAGVFPEAFLAAIPKTDLHVHLDGSLRVSTMIELAQEHGIELPAYTEQGLYDTVYKPHYGSLEEYLEGFRYTVAVLSASEAAMERISYEFAVDNYAENVHYFEVRFAPQLLACPGRDIPDVLRAVNRGLRRATDEYNARPEVIEGKVPAYLYGIIVCGMRFFLPEFSPYYAVFSEVHKYEKPERLYGLASVALVEAALAVKRSDDLPIVGLDIAGAEQGFPADQHAEAYALAHKGFLNKTVHAGESYGPESIFQAITDLHAERIGHGFHIFHAEEVKAKQKNAEEYVRGIVQYVAEHRVTLEICITSNLQTIPQLKGDAKNHAFAQMLENRMSVCICTDNRLVSNTNVTQEVKLAIDSFDLTPKQLKDIMLTGFKRSFCPMPYPKKRAFVRQVIDYYEHLEKLHGVA